MSETGPKRPNLRAVAARDQERLDDATLAERVCAHDPAAETELVRRYRGGLVMLLRRWTGDSALAEDLAQEVFVITLERLHNRRLDDPTKLAAFMRGTAQNLALANRRRDARHRTSSAGDQIYEFADEDADPIRKAIKDQESKFVQRLIGELGVSRDRELLYRYYVAEELKDQICADLGLDTVHFNRVLHRARTRLRELFREALKF